MISSILHVSGYALNGINKSTSLNFLKIFFLKIPYKFEWFDRSRIFIRPFNWIPFSPKREPGTLLRRRRRGHLFSIYFEYSVSPLLDVRYERFRLLQDAATKSTLLSDLKSRNQTKEAHATAYYSSDFGDKTVSFANDFF